MAAGGKKGALAKLRKELQRISKEPPDNIQVSVNERDLLEWHYLLRGPAGTPYEGGWYWGKLKFPPEYPFKPPGILMHTPSGRFETNMRLCLSMSDYHPETWSMAWNATSPLFLKLFPAAENTALRAARGEAVKASGVALTTEEGEEEEEEEPEEEKRTEEAKGGEKGEAKGKEEAAGRGREDGGGRDAGESGGTGSGVRGVGERKGGREEEREGRGPQGRKRGGGRRRGGGHGGRGMGVGATVVICNLNKQAHLNGIRCVVKEVAKDGKIRVKPLEEGMKDMLLKAQNLSLDDDDDE